MVNNTQDKNMNRLSMRHSIMVWVAGAILGWFVAVVSVWSVLKTTESNIAENTPEQEQISPDAAEKMEQVLPAAGPQDEEKLPTEDNPPEKADTPE